MTAKRPLQRRKCAHCRAWFQPRRKNQAYCSLAHGDRYRDRKRGPRLRTKKCPYCAARFTTRAAKQRYCCPEHWQSHHAELSRKRTGPVERRCLLCPAKVVSSGARGAPRLYCDGCRAERSVESKHAAIARAKGLPARPKMITGGAPPRAQIRRIRRLHAA